MSDHPLKMKLKSKKRPTANCRLFVGDPDEYDKVTEGSFFRFLEIFRDFKPDEEMPEEMKALGVELAKEFAEAQEPFFQKFIFKAMNAIKFEELADEYPARPGTDDEAYNRDTFPPEVFKHCLIEPAYDTLTKEEWEAFFDECSNKERRLLLHTAVASNLRNIEPLNPKDLMTR